MLGCTEKQRLHCCVCDSTGHLFQGVCVVGTSASDNSVLCSVRPGASTQRGKGQGREPCKREAAAAPSMASWNRKDRS